MKDLRGFLDELDKLIQSKAPISSIESLLMQKIEFIHNHNKTTTYPIFAAIILNDVEALRCIAHALGDKATDFFKRQFHFNGPSVNALHMACCNGNLETLKTVLKVFGDEKTAAFNLLAGDGTLPLFFARFDSEKFNYLLAEGAGTTLFIPQSQGQTIFEAVYERHYELKKFDNLQTYQKNAYTYSVEYLLWNPVAKLPAKLQQAKNGALTLWSITNQLRLILLENDPLQAFLLVREYLLKAFNLAKAEYIMIEECAGNDLDIIRWLLFTFIGEALIGMQFASITSDQAELLLSFSDQSYKDDPEIFFYIIIKAFISQFSNTKNYAIATSGFEKYKDTFPEVYLLLGFQFFAAQGQPKNLTKARDNYLLAFIKSLKKKDNKTSTLMKIFYEVASTVAINCLKTLINQNDPSFGTIEKMRTSAILVECYLLREQYTLAQEQIDSTDCNLLTQDEKLKFKELAGKVYYQYSKKSKNDADPAELLEKARLMQNSQACFDLANNSIHSAGGSDYISGLELLIESLNAIGEIKVPDIIKTLTEVIEKLQSDQSNQEKIAKLIFNLLGTIYIKITASDDNWSNYKKFLQDLMKKDLFVDKTLSEKYKIFIEYILFTAYNKGREADEKDLNIIKTISFIKASSAEKNRKIDEKLKELKNKNAPFFQALENFKDKPNQGMDEFYNCNIKESKSNDRLPSMEQDAEASEKKPNKQSQIAENSNYQDVKDKDVPLYPRLDKENSGKYYWTSNNNNLSTNSLPQIPVSSEQEVDGKLTSMHDEMKDQPIPQQTVTTLPSNLNSAPMSAIFPPPTAPSGDVSESSESDDEEEIQKQRKILEELERKRIKKLADKKAKEQTKEKDEKITQLQADNKQKDDEIAKLKAENKKLQEENRKLKKAAADEKKLAKKKAAFDLKHPRGVNPAFFRGEESAKAKGEEPGKAGVSPRPRSSSNPEPVSKQASFSSGT